MIVCGISIENPDSFLFGGLLIKRVATLLRYIISIQISPFFALKVARIRFCSFFTLCYLILALNVKFLSDFVKDNAILFVTAYLIHYGNV